MKLIIEQINNRWTVNGRIFVEMTESEKKILTEFIKNYNKNK